VAVGATGDQPKGRKLPFGHVLTATVPTHAGELTRRVEPNNLTQEHAPIRADRGQSQRPGTLALRPNLVTTGVSPWFGRGVVANQPRA
jgi:hypothetical protein